MSETLEQLVTKVAVLEERVRGRDLALELQAAEYERRLTDLNHAHMLAQEKNQEYVRNDTYGTWVNEVSKWRREVDTSLTTLQSSRVAYLASGSLGLSLISVAFLVLSYFKKVI